MDLTVDILRKTSLSGVVKNKTSLACDILRKTSIAKAIEMELIDPPVPESAEIGLVAANIAIITLDKLLDTGQVPDDIDFVAVFSGGAVSITGSAVYSNSTVGVFLSRSIAFGETGTVAYIPGTSKLVGENGYYVAAFTQSVTNNVEAPPSIPVLQSIIVADATPTKIALLYDLTLDEISVPATTAFAVSGKTVTLVEIASKTVTLTVEKYYWNDSGTVAYTKPGSNMIKSALGGEGASFTATAITNNTALDSATTTLIAVGRYTNAPSDALKALINKTIIDLKADGVFAKGDVMCVRGVHESLLACQNWIKNSSNSSLVNAPTFTAKQGFKGNGSTMYLDLNYTPSTEASQLALNDLSVVTMHMQLSTNTARGWFGVQNTGTAKRLMGLFYTGGSTERAYLSSNSYNDKVEMTANGYLGYTRYLVGADPYVQGYLDGSPSGVTVSAVALTLLPTNSILELNYSIDGAAQNPMNAQASFIFIGKGLTATDHLNLYTRMLYFYATVGGCF